MHFFKLAFAAVALATSAAAVELKCIPTQDPYCCDAGASVAATGVEVGVACVKQKPGHVTFCSKEKVKICCPHDAVDLLNLGLVLLCKLPGGLLSEIEADMSSKMLA